MTHRIFWKLYFGYVAVVVLTAAVVFVFVSSTVSSIAEQQTQRQLTQKTALLAPLCEQYMKQARGLEPLIRDLGAETATRFTVIRSDGEVLADSWQDPQSMDDHGTRPEVLEAKNLGVGTARRHSDTIGQAMMYVARVIPGSDGTVGYVRAARSLQAMQNELNSLRRRILGGAVLAALVGLIPSIFLGRWVARPLQELNQAARRLAGGDYDTPILTSDGGEFGRLAFHLDSMRGQLRDRLQAITQDRNKLASVLSGMVEGVVAVDLEERVVHINAAAGTILQVDPHQAVGKRIWELPRSRAAAELLERSMNEGTAIMVETPLLDLHDERIVEILASPLRDAEGKLTGGTVMLHDITSLRRLEKVRRDFVANASHELSTPIAAIVGVVETMLDDPDMPQATREQFLERMRGQADRLSDLTGDLVTLSRLEDHDRGDPERTDFCALVQETVDVLRPRAEQKGLEVHVELPQAAVEVRAWAEDLRQVIDNLVGNAIKYTPAGSVRVHLEVDDGEAVLKVEDTGIGIEPVHHQRVFERFYRTDEARTRQAGGSGLGLAIVRNIAESLGGGIRLDSEPGVGSRFQFRIPLSPASLRT